MHRIIFAGTGSGTGKTTVSTAVMRVLSDRGRRVAPFKAGPDFIDPKFHSIACRTESRNLDQVLNDALTVKYLFNKNTQNYDIAVIEGVMGLYDGSGFDGTGSTAELSLMLNAPVVLIVNAMAMSESVCAVVLGFKLYNPEINIKGVILNNIHDENYYHSLKTLITSKTGIECLGYFPGNKIYNLTERHLGLIPVEERTDIEEYINSISQIASDTIDINRIEKIAGDNKPLDDGIILRVPQNIHKNIRIGIARDRAFNFYYEDNLTLMRDAGIELVEFSPLKDDKLPDDICGLYIGGGFPEIFAGELSANHSMLYNIKNSLENGLPCYAECGGLMYLTKYIKDQAGKSFDMAGFFNTGSVMTGKLQRFGYVEVEYEGITTRAHEFHYSEVESNENRNFVYKYNIKKINNGKSEPWNCGLSRKNVLSGYPHVHFYSNFDFFNKILDLFKKA